MAAQVADAPDVLPDVGIEIHAAEAGAVGFVVAAEPDRDSTPGKDLRFEIGERMSAAGEVLVPIDERELWELEEKLVRERVESVAVCFLHAYAYPRHEQIVGEFLRRHLPELVVSLSSEVLRVRKEYERTATTVVNAYVRPIMTPARPGAMHPIAGSRMCSNLLESPIDPPGPNA